MKKLLLILVLAILFCSCEKSIIASNESKIVGTWQLQKAVIITTYRVLRNGSFTDSTIVETLPSNINKNLFSETGLNADYFQLGDRWTFEDHNLILKSGQYDYQYLSSTNYVQITVATTNRSYKVTTLNKGELELISPTQSINNSTKKYFLLKFVK